MLHSVVIWLHDLIIWIRLSFQLFEFLSSCVFIFDQVNDSFSRATKFVPFPESFDHVALPIEVFKLDATRKVLENCTLSLEVSSSPLLFDLLLNPGADHSHSHYFKESMWIWKYNSNPNKFICIWGFGVLGTSVWLPGPSVMCAHPCYAVSSLFDVHTTGGRLHSALQTVRGP